MQTRIDPARVSVVPTTLLDAGLVALEGDEFAQVRGRLAGSGRQRCAWGVLYTVARRAGVADPLPRDIDPRMVEIAAALRQARTEVEAERGGGNRDS